MTRLLAFVFFQGENHWYDYCWVVMFCLICS